MTGGRRQQGVALLIMLAIVGLGAAWIMTSQLNAESGGIEALRKKRNAEVLNRAKQALIGYVAAQAVKSGEDNPGSLPCPEADGYFDSTTQDGQSASSCTLPRIGRFPWRTIGTDKLVDSSGEPLWMAVSVGWARQAGNTIINSNSVGQLTVDGVAAVAVIIAPGPAFSVPAVTGCAARNQVRVIAGTPNIRNYLECDNATSGDGSFVTTGPSGSFNDQVITITAAEILPGIEAAIANRIEREIAPALRSMYTGNPWSGDALASPPTIMLPVAATFTDPTASSMQGVIDPMTLQPLLQGLLPLVQTETAPGSRERCDPVVAGLRCVPGIGNLTGATMTSATTYSENCAVTNDADNTYATINCNFYYRCLLVLCALPANVFYTIDVVASDVAKSMRSVSASYGPNTGILSVAPSSAALSSDGSATVTLSGVATPTGGGGLVDNLLCGLGVSFIWGCKAHAISIQVSLFVDHSILDSTSLGTGATGWFLRNKWHETAYYAIAPGFAPGGARTCVDGATCLTVAYHRNSSNMVDSGKQHAAILLSGRSLNNVARPNGTLADWLEGANADGTSPFEMRSASLMTNRAFNDRVAVLSSNP